MTGTPDAEAAWQEWANDPDQPDVPPTVKQAFEAGFAAAEGPWREHIAQELFANAETRKNEWEAIAVRSAARIVRGTNES